VGETHAPPLDLLNDIRIASPCHEAWDRMTGDDRARHCGSCDKTVYNLSAMTADEAAALFREREGRICVRLYRRRDGTVLTADCPVGRAKRFRRRVRYAVVVAASWLGLLPATGCEDRSRTTDMMGSPAPLNRDGECLAGEAVIEPSPVEEGPMPREVKE
jgi:hypothetical protein